MTIIDFHTHVFPKDLAPRVIETLSPATPEGRGFTDGTTEALKRSMLRSGISRSVVLPVATKKEQVPTINVFQSTLDDSSFIPFGAIHPEGEDVEGMPAELKRRGFAGVKLHPEYQHFHIDAVQYYPLYEALSDAGLITVFHAGKDPGPFSCDHALPPAIGKVASMFPRLKMVAAHMGGWKMWNDVYEELCGLPIFFDTSAVYGCIDRELFLKMMRKHGVDRILFGSDSPWVDQNTAREWIASLPVSDSDKERIFHLNAQELISDAGRPVR